MPIKYPLIYLKLYCKLRNKGTGNITCSKAEFRRMLSQPLGIDKRLSEFILRDMKRYRMIKNITRGKRGKVEFVKTSDNAYLFADLIELRRVGLI